VPPSVSDIEDQPTHDACLPGFHHGTHPRCLFTRFSPLDKGISLYYFDFFCFFTFFFGIGGQLHMAPICQVFTMVMNRRDSSV